MKHILQKNEVDCGFAVAAMLAGVTYSRAHKADPCPEKSTGLSVGDFVEVLTAVSGASWTVARPSKYPLLADFVVPKKCALLIRFDGDAYGHWIACDDGVIHDPDMIRAVSFVEYDRLDWRVVRIVTEA